MGADIVNAARAFMLSLGCIQARECNMNTCPVGIATQNKSLIKGLNPYEKKFRVANYHKAVTHEVADVIAAMGYTSIHQVEPSDIMVRAENGELKSL
jgi:glutamate synthase domain-containing protein 2